MLENVRIIVGIQILADPSDEMSSGFADIVGTTVYTCKSYITRERSAIGVESFTQNMFLL